MNKDNIELLKSRDRDFQIKKKNVKEFLKQKHMGIDTKFIAKCKDENLEEE